MVKHFSLAGASVENQTLSAGASARLEDAGEFLFDFKSRVSRAEDLLAQGH